MIAQNQQLKLLDELLALAKENSDPLGDCWIWRGKTRIGYAYLYHKENPRYEYLARWITQLRGDDPKECVRHKCDNKLCVNPDHITTGTQVENRNDSRINGTLAVGLRNGMARIPPETVLWIRAQPIARAADARRLGVSYGHLNNIHKGRKRLYD